MQEGPDPCPEGLEEVARVVEGLQDDHGHDLGGERGPADQDDLQPAAGGGEGVQAALQGAHHVPASTDPVLRDAGQQCQGGDPHQFIILLVFGSQASGLSSSLDSREPPVVPVPREGGIRGGGGGGGGGDRQ